MIIASFGATAVLCHSAVKSPLAQPRNLMLGHISSAIVGVTVYKVIIIMWWMGVMVVIDDVH